MKQALFAFTFLLSLNACQSQASSDSAEIYSAPPVLFSTGSEQINKYLPLIKDLSIALVVNHTSMVAQSHLVDTLLSLGVSVKKVFAPEHGFRGAQEAGEQVTNSVDVKTGLPILSLYGANKKPSVQQLQDIDVVIFDIQDVGVRFYTYISTMHYVMEACAENGKTMLVLDRPNPNGDYVDGPILRPEQRSFVGLHPIPIVHGLTVGELAGMINGQKWLEGSRQCKLEVIPMDNYYHQMTYELPVKPSPNLPTYQSIRLYPSLCLFEGTDISVGRGTLFPFQVYGHPAFTDSAFSFTPVAIPGMDQNPKHRDQLCGGWDLRQITPPAFTLKFLIQAYNLYPEKDSFFKDYFNLLAGTDVLMGQIREGIDESVIKAGWQQNLNDYKAMRLKYLLYPDTAP